MATNALQFISVKPAERGTAVVTITPVDEAGEALSFAQLSNPQWQLMKTDGTVIPGCAFGDNVMTGLTFVLSGSDLAIFGDGDSGGRCLALKCEYNSSLGSDLPLHVECRFAIQDMLGVANST